MPPTSRAELPAGVTAPGEGLPFLHPRSDQSVVHVVGAHGGAGESTVTTILQGYAVGADHAWPYLDPAVYGATARFPVLLVCKTSMGGLLAAQRALRQYISGQAFDGVKLLGLVAVHDAPGRLPKELRSMLRIVSGGIPGPVWELPYIESLRLGVDVHASPTHPSIGNLRASIIHHHQKEKAL